MKTKTKRLPVLNRIETHGGRNVPVYRMHTVELDENGQPIWEKKISDTVLQKEK